MLKHRLSKIGKATLFVLCALFVGGMFQSCDDVLFQDALDDYHYDDGDEPSWLGSSVYNFLRDNNSGHTYNYYADIVDALGETEQFSKTGSKTVFVADDAAFERFFENNSWGVSSFDELTVTQMKLILKASMLDDAMLLDMLSATSANEADEGKCLRRSTSLKSVDSIPVITAMQTPKYNKYWDALRGKDRDETMRIAMDGSNPMMVHFLPDYLKNNSITEEDMSFLFRKNGVQVKTYKEGDIFIYDKKVVASDVPDDGFSGDNMTITCKNGYLYRLDDLLIPPSNMAEEIRRRVDTQIFSHIMDRYCLPVYNPDLSSAYLSATGKEDSIFSLRYYSQGGAGGIRVDNTILKDKDRPASSNDVLKYDPGCNVYANGSISAQEDMAAMFVPSDEAMYEYFIDGGGKLLLEEYNKEDDPSYVNIVDFESLKLALNKVPDNLIASLINIHMQNSFKGTTPSRLDQVRDDGNDEIPGVREMVTECVIANNGVIYIINNVFGPSEFSTVSAPVSVLENMMIMRRVISELGYNSFLMAKQAVYSLFAPDDASFVYYDPVSLYANKIEPTLKPKVWHFIYDDNYKNEKRDKKYLYAKIYEFDPETYEIDPTTMEYSNEQIDFTTLKGDFGGAGGNRDNIRGFLYYRMSDLIDYLIVTEAFVADKKYYKAKNGGAIVVDMTDPDNPIFQGGEQVENGHRVATKDLFKYPNGITYTTVQLDETSETNLYSGMPTPSTKSLYTQIAAQAVEAIPEEEEGGAEGDEDPLTRATNVADLPFAEFYKLLEPSAVDCDLEKLLCDLFLLPDASNYTTIIRDSMKNYSTFYTSTNKSGLYDGQIINGVPAFCGYNYTVYIPSNDAVKEFINSGMPTWQDIQAAALGTGVYAAFGPAPKQAAAAMRLLRDVIRYHLQDNSIFVDNNSISAEYETLAIGESGTYMKVGVNAGNGYITVTDELGGQANVITDEGMENKTWNVLCRDYEFYSELYSMSYVPKSIVTSSFSVAHHIDNVLKFKALRGYDGGIQRFSLDGERVVTMAVEGNTSNGLITDDNGNNLYLVAEVGTVDLFEPETSGIVSREVGYLMKPRNGSFTKLSREDLVYDQDGSKILICDNGYRVVRGDYDANKKTYQYNYYVDADGNKLKYANNGTVIEKTPLNPTQDEENNTDVVE